MTWKMRILLSGLGLLSTGSASAQAVIFRCTIGTRQATVTLDGDRLTYRFGPPGRPDITVVGGPATGNVAYHRQLYPRGELQTLRFDRGNHSYLVRSLWMAPSGNSPEFVEAGIDVIRGGRELRRLDCRSGGDMREYPIFGRLPQAEGSNRPS